MLIIKPRPEAIKKVQELLYDNDFTIDDTAVAVYDDGFFVFYDNCSIDYDDENEFYSHWEIIEDHKDPIDIETTKLLGVSDNIDHAQLISNGNAKITKKIKSNVATLRANLIEAQEAAELKIAKVESLIAAQKRALNFKANQLAKLLDKANQALHCVNLYLGHNEEIIPILNGKPANANELIHLRQSFIYMDEECQASLDDQGIDIKDCHKFDEWLQNDPSAIDTLIPEQKAIIGMHIKRNNKEYGDAYLDTEINEANKNNTFLLIRNGQKVYRTFINLVLGPNLFPTKKEFDDIFSSFGQQVKPGHSDYLKSMKNAENLRLHYMKVLLCLQGLIDRTDILAPLPATEINLCNKADYDKHLKFIYDGENLLAVDNMDFKDWLKKVNGKLEVGCRIMGAFNTLNARSELLPGECYSGKINPKYGRLPPSGVLHLIETKKDNEFVIRYDREVYDRHNWETRKSITRVSCRLSKNYDFIINFDAVTIEECERYIKARINRKHYLSMLPLLRKCIELKRQEIETELPFRQLLVSELFKKYGHKIEDIESKIDDLITWYKFKNKNHRALCSDDVKALRMIIKQYKSEHNKTNVRSEITEFFKRSVIKSICANQEPLLIAHQRDNRFIALIPIDNHWVIEQYWRSNNGSIYLHSEKSWKIVDNRYMIWDVYYVNDKWESWPKNLNPNDLLHDDEIIELSQQIVDHFRIKRDDESILQIKLSKTRQLVVYTASLDDDKNLYDKRINFHYYPIAWERRNGKIKFYFDLKYCRDKMERQSQSPSCELIDGKIVKTSSGYISDCVIIDQQATDYFNELDKSIKISKSNFSKCRVKAERLLKSHFKTLYDNKINQLKKEYLEQYGSLKGFEKHIKSKNVREPYSYSLVISIATALYYKLDIKNKTIYQILNMVNKYEEYDLDDLEVSDILKLPLVK